MTFPQLSMACNVDEDLTFAFPGYMSSWEMVPFAAYQATSFRICLPFESSVVVVIPFTGEPKL